MRLAGLALAALTVFMPEMALADNVLVVVAADNGIYEDPVRNEAERLVSEGGHSIKPFGDAVVDAGLNPSEILRCVDKAPACMKTAVEAAAVDGLLVFQLKSDAADGGPQVAISGWYFDARSGQRVKGGQRFCEKCTQLEELVKLSQELTTELMAGSAAAAVDTAIEVYTTPKGATILIDGVEVGPEGQVYKVAPGPHQIETRLAGHSSVEVRVEAVANQTHTERLTLVPVAPPPVDDGIGWVYKWVALGGGVVATTLGVAWIAMDGPQSEDGPGGIQVRKPEERTTLVPGIVTTTVGVGLLGLSGYLFYREMATENGTQASVIATDGGALLGVSGRF